MHIIQFLLSLLPHKASSRVTDTRASPVTRPSPLLHNPGDQAHDSSTRKGTTLPSRHAAAGASKTPYSKLREKQRHTQIHPRHLHLPSSESPAGSRHIHPQSQRAGPPGCRAGSYPLASCGITFIIWAAEGSERRGIGFGKRGRSRRRRRSGTIREGITFVISSLLVQELRGKVLGSDFLRL